VRVADGSTFAPELKLTLTELRLVPAGDPPELTVTDSTATTRATRTARTFEGRVARLLLAPLYRFLAFFQGLLQSFPRCRVV
jgi:hypothetical protein